MIICTIFSRLGSEARDCNGPRKQYRVCENPPCPAGLPGFRDWQCQASGVRASSSKHVLQWQAVTDEGRSDQTPCLGVQGVLQEQEVHSRNSKLQFPCFSLNVEQSQALAKMHIEKYGALPAHLLEH